MLGRDTHDGKGKIPNQRTHAGNHIWWTHHVMTQNMSGGESDKAAGRGNGVFRNVYSRIADVILHSVVSLQTTWAIAQVLSEKAIHVVSIMSNMRMLFARLR